MLELSKSSCYSACYKSDSTAARAILATLAAPRAASG